MAGTTRLERAIRAIKAHDGRDIGIPAFKDILRSKLAISGTSIIDYCHALEAAGVIREHKQGRLIIDIPKSNEQQKL